MDPKQSKRFNQFSRFWNVMSWIVVVLGIITTALTVFSLWTGDRTASVIGLLLVTVAIVTVAITRSAAKEAKRLSQYKPI